MPAIQEHDHTNSSLEQRVADLEKKVADLQRLTGQQVPSEEWDSTFGIFANDPEFDEIVRLGREYRDQQNRNDQE